MIKRNYTYTLLGISLLCASCSQDDATNFVTRPVADARIEFRASLPAITSRATEVKDETLGRFMVSSFIIGETSAVPHFLYKSFDKNETTGKFISSDPECIWPENDDALRFVAFYPSCEDMRLAGGFGEDNFKLPSLTVGEDMGAYDYKLTNFRIAADIAKQTDFVTAIASGSMNDNEDNGITLNFGHRLSRIELNAWGASQSFDLEIAGVRIGGAATGGTFSFTPAAEADDASQSGKWESVTKGIVEYIYREGDKIVTISNTGDAQTSASKAVSIMGDKITVSDNYSYDNSAMVIPSGNIAWDYKNNPKNTDSDGNPADLYFSILVRVTDTTPYNHGATVYPYADNNGMEVIYLAADADGNVKTRLYRQGDEYFTDEEYTAKYDLEANNAVAKAFGWAALPVAGEWKPGYIYTYTLNYTYGVGLHDPADDRPGTPIISDNVMINVEMSEWIRTDANDVTVPRK